MKILYAIQGTGNGHLARALEVVPVLKRYGKVHILISGTQVDLKLPWKVKYRKTGLGFVFGKSGGLDWAKTFYRFNLMLFLRDIFTLPVRKYDLVISDFEPVTSWSCRLKGVPCVGMSHQLGVLQHLEESNAKTSFIGKLILKHYAPSDFQYGFHFKANGDKVFPPVIRSSIRREVVSNAGHYTVYLPAFEDKKIIKVLSQFPSIKWEVFSKHTSAEYNVDNIWVYPVQNDLFVRSMVSCEGVLCTAGFETPAEALFLKKKLCVIPMKGQYEQGLNAQMLAEMGIPVLTDLGDEGTLQISQWLIAKNQPAVHFPDITDEIIDKVIKAHARLSTMPSWV